MTGPARLEGYRECHICAVKEKMRAPRCYHCTGTLDLKDLLLLESEKRWRQRIAPILSIFIPGLGHWFSGRRYVGTYFFAMAPLSIGFVLTTYKNWSWGLTVLTASFVLVWFLTIFDSKRGTDNFKPPCQVACPVEIPCSHYVHLLAAGKDVESLELIEALCPFPGTIGRICHHPCEGECNRGKDGEPVAICVLKRFLDDEIPGSQDLFRKELEKESHPLGQKVAVVGAGPSGLSATLYLRLFGFDVSLFEARESAGGAPLVYLPHYRLPREVYRREVDRVLGLDLDLRFGQRMGKDFTLQDLQGSGFSAAYLAMGASRPIVLPHTGSESEGFLDGREFLEWVAQDGETPIDGEVLVIGGGNVAMDAARSAVRCGAKRVRVICLEKQPGPRDKKFRYRHAIWQEVKPDDGKQFMPANPWEIADVLTEGIEIVDGSATVNFDIRDGKVVSAQCLRVERIDQDQHGKLVPVLLEDTEFTLKADRVITAVGSSPDFSFLGEIPGQSPVSDRAPLVRLHEVEGITIPLLVGGDMASGPASVIEGIRAGKEAALYLYRKLAGTSPVSIRYRSRRIMEPWANYKDSLDFRTRRQEITLSADERRTSFKEIRGGLTGKMAREEAERCMRCDWPLMRESKVRKFFRMVKNRGGATPPGV